MSNNPSPELCPCGSGKLFADCCEPVILGARKAKTPEELMRARYSAYATCHVDFILDSTHPEQRATCDRQEVKNWAEQSEWDGFTILRTERGGEKDSDGIVEFVAHYKNRNMQMEHHEISEFRRSGGEWFFYDGAIVGPKPYVRTAPKVGPNDPCPCGSGKKYKKCCGK